LKRPAENGDRFLKCSSGPNKWHVVCQIPIVESAALRASLNNEVNESGTEHDLPIARPEACLK
jgi:hypothetical protein